MRAGYMYIWEYRVAPDHVREFERAYGPRGEWVRLFRRAPGYLRTELHRDLAQPLRFVTIDYWKSQETWEAFRRTQSQEFEDLDAKCAEWTTSETKIGRFEPAE